MRRDFPEDSILVSTFRDGEERPPHEDASECGAATDSVSATARAQINAGELKPEPDLPFTMIKVAEFKLPWRIAFLPDGRMLITEKVGPVWLVTQQGEKTPVESVPAAL